MKAFLTALLALPLLAGCRTLSAVEQQQYENLLAQGAEPIDAKDPAIAGLLNLLPGGGDIYNHQWDAFVVDLLLWYPSVLWAVPQGIVTARNANKLATIAYYSVGPGKAHGFDPDEPRIGP